MGIDPGVKGGLALLTDAGEVVETVPLDGLKELDVSRVFRKWTAEAVLKPLLTPVCFIEKVGYIKGDGAGGSFTFGSVFGLLRGLALGYGMIPHYVYPMVWQSHLSCMSGGNKNVTKNKAIELFPLYHKTRPRGITHGIADALLIAEYGRRVLGREGEITLYKAAP